jgi:hypothetical protein
MVESLESTVFRCKFCNKDFRRENSLAVHVCEQKKRYQEREEVGVQIGLQAYLRFYEVTQGSARLKTFEDFAASPYYRAFVKFGRYVQSIRAIAVPRYTDWLLKHNKKLDQWCRDSFYTEFLSNYVREEHVDDALARALETGLRWSEETGSPSDHYLRYGNANAVCYAITTGRITAWILYNCDSGNEFLANLNQEQLAMIWPWIDADFWSRKFHDYPADAVYVRELLTKAGW